MAIPAFLLVLALTGMALSTESRQQFEERAGQGDPGDQFPDEFPDSDFFDDPQFDPNVDPGDFQPGQTDGQGSTGQPGEIGDGQIVEGEGSGQGEAAGSTPVIITTENGDIVVQLDENGEPIRVVPGDAQIPTDDGRILTPDENGNLVGFRVTEEGSIEPVEDGQTTVNDYLLRPSADGVDIIRPDGTRVQLRPNDDGSLDGSVIERDGTTSELAAEDGDIVVSPFEDLPPTAGSDPTGEPLIVQTEDGPVRLDFGPDGDLVADQPSGEIIEIDPDDLSAIRVNEDGSLELVPLDEVQPSDTLLVPTGDGFDLVRPDGSRVEFRADGENDGTTATEITADGQEIELTPNPDGSVTLEDGTTVGPIDIAEDGGAFEQFVDRASDLPWPWVFGAIALLTLLSIGTAVYLHRTKPESAFDYSQFVTTGVPEDQFENFLAILRADPDPTRAIRLGFYAAERGLGGLPPRRAEETPFEWLARVERHRPHLAEALTPICDLFARARFGSEPPTLEDRDLMVEHLRALNRIANAATTGAAAGPDLAGIR